MNKFNDKNVTIGPINQIVYAWNYLNWGGAQIYFLGLIKEAKKHFEITVLMPVGSDEQLQKFFTEQGVVCEFFEPALPNPTNSPGFSRIRHHFGKIRSEHAMLRKLDELFDLKRTIVHIELSPWQSLLSLIWLSLRTRVFLTMHNSLPPVNPIRKTLWRLKLRIISQFKNFHAFASNEDAKRYFKGLYSRDFYERLPVTYTNVDPFEIEEALGAELDREALRKNHGIPAESFVVICVGQFIDRKGRWTFLEAAKMLVAEEPNIRFVWVSNSVLSADDEDRIASYGLRENFSLIASEDVGTEHIDLFKFIRAADTFVLPSFQEGLPISLLEGMALGLPCISTRVNAIPEAVRHLETGLLIEAGDAAGLAEAITQLKNDDSLRESVRIAGREIVLKRFNEKEVAKIALTAYFEASKLKEHAE